ncbi:hypothetical protein IWW36_000864 [Coemansia brasiliensis]|uniref:Large ribosomal subunit protein mL54 n=1 Tax=Coemansia brasiliensis TaxID=2650707 RepID=A0A9W8LZK2_9FUNG|nr:hypothetical protein IWW36_000864 [Coemansia brasiliensis]
MYTRLLFANSSARYVRAGCQTYKGTRGIASSLILRTAEKSAEPANEAQPTQRKYPASSAVHGTVLKGLNIYKAGKDPVALKDEEYPDWLWTLLDEVPVEKMTERERQRHERSKHIKESNFMKSRK